MGTLRADWYVAGRICPIQLTLGERIVAEVCRMSSHVERSWWLALAYQKRYDQQKRDMRGQIPVSLAPQDSARQIQSLDLSSGRGVRDIPRASLAFCLTIS